MKAIVELENMEFRAGHGCYELEKKVGNRFLVSVSMETEAGAAARNDDLNAAVNYASVYEVVRREMSKTSDILENVAWRIAGAVRDGFPGVLRITVKVSKLAPPLGGKTEKVSVTITI